MTDTIHVPISHVQLSSGPVSDQERPEAFLSTPWIPVGLYGDGSRNALGPGTTEGLGHVLDPGHMVSDHAGRLPQRNLLESDALESDIADLQGKRCQDRGYRNSAMATLCRL